MGKEKFGKIKYFNGIKYERWETASGAANFTKKSAYDLAEDERRAGYRARVVKNNRGGYYVYCNYSRRKR